MLDLKPLQDCDIPLVESWLNKAHVRRWYEIPRLGVTIEDWMSELNGRHGDFRWLHHLLVMWQGAPIGLCQYYSCADSGENFGELPVAGSYGIDYLIGEEDCLGKGLGKGMVALLVHRIFSFPDALRVTADIDPENQASARTLLACGFELFDPVESRYVIHKPV